MGYNCSPLVGKTVNLVITIKLYISKTNHLGNRISILFSRFYTSPKNNSIIVWHLMVLHCGMPCLTTFVLLLLLLHSGKGSNHTFLTWPLPSLIPFSPWCLHWCRPLLCPQTYKIAKRLCLMRLRVCNCRNKHYKSINGMERKSKPTAKCV